MSFQPTFDPIAAARLGLSRMEKEMRLSSIRGSDCNIIVNGSDWERDRLIGVKRGTVEPEDLSRNKACLAGTFNEVLNVMFYEIDTGIRVYARNSTETHPFEPHYGCSLDGLVDHPEHGKAVFEAKYTGMTNLETITRTYMPQLVHNMDCCGLRWAILSVMMAGTKYGFVSVEMDDDYLAALRARTDLVWRAIQSDDGILDGPLPEMPKPTMPPVFLRSETVDLNTVKGANRIAVLAPQFIETHDAAKLNAKVSKELKTLLPDDAPSEGCGIKCTINAAGAKSISVLPTSITTVDEAVTEPAANDDHLSY